MSDEHTYDDDDQEGDSDDPTGYPAQQVSSEDECDTLEEVEHDVFTAMLCQGFAEGDAEVASIVQAETTAFLAWGAKGKSAGKGKKGSSKGKKGRPRFSKGMKPNLSLEERKKALTSSRRLPSAMTAEK